MRAAKDAAGSIPIVMAAGSSDPVAEGYIASFARPSGNVTGLTFAVSSERFGKQLELLKEAVGTLSHVAMLWDGDLDLFRRSWAPALESAARHLGLNIHAAFISPKVAMSASQIVASISFDLSLPASASEPSICATTRALALS